MATVTGYTAARMKQIEDSAIIDGDVVGDNLILKRYDALEINAGNVRGPQGSPGLTVATFTTAQRNSLAGADLWAGRIIFNSTTVRIEWYNGVVWQEVNTLATFTTLQRNALSGLDIWPGRMIYNSTEVRLEWFTGIAWEAVNKFQENGMGELLLIETTTSTVYANLATVGPSVTVKTGTKALVIIAAYVNNNTAAGSCNVGVAVSGASVIAPIDEASLYLGVPVINASMVASHSRIMPGLTPGLNTFTLKYKQNGGTATFAHRRISVVDMGS